MGMFIKLECCMCFNEDLWMNAGKREIPPTEIKLTQHSLHKEKKRKQPPSATTSKEQLLAGATFSTVITKSVR